MLIWTLGLCLCRLLFFAMGCGTGSGLTAINNLAQVIRQKHSEFHLGFL